MGINNSVHQVELNYDDIITYTPLSLTYHCVNKPSMFNGVKDSVIEYKFASDLGPQAYKILDRHTKNKYKVLMANSLIYGIYNDSGKLICSSRLTPTTLGFKLV